MRFEFATASRIIFGKGTLKEAAPLAAEMGRRALVITGGNVERALPLLASLTKTGIECVTFSVTGEPTTNSVMDGVQSARDNACEIIVAMGGGSALDAGKAIAALLTNNGDITDYLEVIGQGKKLTNAPVPCIAIPTTAGTGAEVTKNSVLTSPEHKVKVSLRSPMMLPDLAIVDPELTYSMPPAITAGTGLDALTQVLESFVSIKSNPLTDALCIDGLKRAAWSLRQAFADGSHPLARENMAIVSLYGGLALANSKLGAVHGFAGPMGAMFPAPHGIICARLLPFVMEVNVRVLRRNDYRQSLLRYDEVAKTLTGRPDARAEDGIAWIHDLCETLNVPSLSNFGVTDDHFAELVVKSKKASSMKGNPVELTDEELTEILTKAAA